MKLCIFTSMIYPVPAVKGGAVEGLIELLINENEKYHKMDITVVSIYDAEAKKESDKYKYTKFIYVKRSSFWDKFWSKKFFLYLNKVAIKLKGKTIVSMPFLKKAWIQIKEKEFDRYVVEGGGDSYNFGFLMKKIPREKLYIHYHGEVCGNEYLNNMFGKHIAVSNYIARKLICNGKIDSKNVDVLPNCFDASSMVSTVDRELIRKKYSIKKTEFVFVYWGRILPEKGVLELLKAFNIVARKNVNVKLLIIGNATFGKSSCSKYDKKLKTIVNSNMLKDKVVFTGFIPHSQIGSILSASDAGIIPSIWDDPAPLTVFEGMSKGLPLIAAQTGGIPEIIKDSENGILVRWSKEYTICLAKEMQGLIIDKEKRKRISENALLSVNQYNSDIYYNNYVNLVSVYE